MTFAAAPEYQVFPTRERPLKPYEAAVRAARETVPSVEAFAPDLAVSDILTPAPALAAELCGVPVATLVPHVHPGRRPASRPTRSARGCRGRALGALGLAPRSTRSSRAGSSRAGDEYNDCRARLGLPPLPGLHTGLSRALTLVATLPQLEYPRRVGAVAAGRRAAAVGAAGASASRRRRATGPVVLIAPSTAQDPEHALLRAALAGLAGAPVRVIATYNGRDPGPVDVPANAVLVPWLSYARTMPGCDLVVTHGGHGTLVRALSCGCPVVVCPAGGDMAENAARADWAGVGVRLPRRLLGPRALRLAVGRALRDAGMRDRARAVAAWVAAHDGADAAARELEALAG